MKLSRFLSAFFNGARGETASPTVNAPVQENAAADAQAHPERKTIETYRPFLAEIDAIKSVTRNNVKAYEMILLVDNVPHLVPAILTESLQPYSDTKFEELKKGDIVRAGAIGNFMEYYVPQSILGTIEKCPPGTPLENEGPVELGYTVQSFKMPSPESP